VGSATRLMTFPTARTRPLGAAGRWATQGDHRVDGE
jgi:hypothetical protein